MQSYLMSKSTFVVIIFPSSPFGLIQVSIDSLCTIHHYDYIHYIISNLHLSQKHMLSLSSE